MAKEAIDFVLAWVDGSDPLWRARKAALQGTELADDREQRYRAWGMLKYWFRGVEKFAPWARKVWLICDQEPPEWLDRECPRIGIARHEDFMPAEYRPAFSSHPIELNMHRIPGLSERFVYFNDDMFLTAPVKEEDFFRKGLPRDSALMNPVPTTDLVAGNSAGRIFTIPLNNAEYLNRDYNFRECVRKHPGKWMNFRYGGSAFRNLMLTAWPRFVGFHEPHIPQAFLKSAFEEAWEADGDILDATSRHHIRDDRDVNQWLIRERQLAEGKFMPKRPAKNAVFDLGRQSAEAAETIRRQREKMICMNDGEISDEEFGRIRKILIEAFESILPKKSVFEKV